jgi:uncharacterized protein YjbI with pentapeptide repeats
MCFDDQVALAHRQQSVEWWRNYFGAKRRRTRSVPLLVAVVSAVLIGAALIWLGFIVFGHIVGIDNTPSAKRADVLKTALSAVAGVGGAVALVVAYRRQQDLEEGRFVERFGAAAGQLGDHDPAVRIAGVYAMAGVADERKTTFGRRQQCIDVLCGYLRLPYDPAHGESHLTEFVTTTRPEGEGEAYEEVRHQAIRQNDREVRQTIVRVIAAHLQKNADVSWSLHDFDFTTVLFEDADWSGAVFRGEKTTFGGASFGGFINFDLAAFEGEYTWFKNAKFSGDKTLVNFDGAMFSGTTSFAGAEFSCPRASFAGVVCSGDKSLITFERARFDVDVVLFDNAKLGAGTTSFKKATFVTKVTSFDGTEFNGSATTFENATFSGKKPPPEATIVDSTTTSFQNAIFSGDTVSYARAQFSGTLTRFTRSEFRDTTTVSFDNAQFKDDQTTFDNAKFSGKAATFAWARFDNRISAVFDKAQFTAYITSFESATFCDTSLFNKVTFGGETLNFNKAKFMKSLASFEGAIFSATETYFNETEFHGTTMFGEAVFEGATATATFDKVIFASDSGGHTTFRGAKFNNKMTLFSQPRVWKNVGFDWDIFPDEMPACISPRTWPPTLLAKGE